MASRASSMIAWIRLLVPMALGAGLLYLTYLLVTANGDPVKVDFLIGRIELATWQVVGLSFVAGAGLVGLYTLFVSARGGLVRRRYRKELAGLETEVHQLRNLPLAPAEEGASRPEEPDFELQRSGGPGGKDARAP